MPSTNQYSSLADCIADIETAVYGRQVRAAMAEGLSMVSTIPQNSVRYDIAQSLETAQKNRARGNIGAIEKADVVRYDQSQQLADAAKAIARGNIGAITKEDVVRYDDFQDLNNNYKLTARTNIGAITVTITPIPNKADEYCLNIL